jgi:hypothetical protein
MTSFICDTQEHEEVQKLLSIHDHKREAEILHAQAELLSLMDNLLMLFTLHEQLYERPREGDLPGSVTSEYLPSSQQESSEKSTHSKGSFASEDESRFLKKVPL